MDTAAAIASAVIAWIVAGGALTAWFLNRRAAELRRDDVLAWANDAIDVLQSIVLVCRLGEGRLPKDEALTRMRDFMFRTSILVERGRLYFRNVSSGDFGIEKPPAYRGLRPRILDHLVVAHQIACEWPTASLAERKRMGFLAEDAVKSFVSTAQREVGRSRTAFGGAARQGSHVHLSIMLKQISDEALRLRGWD